MGLLRSGFVYDEVRDRVASAAIHNDVPMIDLSAQFARQAKPLELYAADGHFSARGATLAASALDRAFAKGAMQ